MYRFDLSLIISVAIILALGDIFFYTGHKFLHNSKYMAHLHLMHHCCIVPSASTNLLFHPIDFAIEFFGPIGVMLSWYFITGDNWVLIVSAVIIQVWYAFEHDENIILHHQKHHTDCNSDYPIYIEYINPNPKDKVKHILRR